MIDSKDGSLSRQRILIVDDNGPEARGTARTLEASGYEVAVTLDARHAIELFPTFRPHLVLTDLVMPGIGGVELCRFLRKESDVQIVVLSASGDEPKKVEALDAGADDYLTKPFSREECLARVRAALRRAPPPAPAKSQIVETEHFRIDLGARTVHVQGQEVHFTPIEFDLLAFLVRRPGEVVDHAKLLMGVWDVRNVQSTQNVRVFVRSVRKKIEPDPENPRYILTVRLGGYRFDPDRGPSDPSGFLRSH